MSTVGRRGRGNADDRQLPSRHRERQRRRGQRAQAGPASRRNGASTADARPSAAAMRAVTARITVALATASRTDAREKKRHDLDSALSRRVDHPRQAIQFGAGQLAPTSRRAARRSPARPIRRKRSAACAAGRPLRVVPRNGGQVDVTRAVLLVADVPLFLEDPQQRADGRIARRFRQRGLDLGRRGLAALIKDVEDLPLAAAQIPVVVVHTDA